MIFGATSRYNGMIFHVATTHDFWRHKPLQWHDFLCSALLQSYFAVDVTFSYHATSKDIKTLKTFFSNFKGLGPLKFKINLKRPNHKLSIDNTFDPCSLLGAF
jgi:hypothetical protein